MPEADISVQKLTKSCSVPPQDLQFKSQRGYRKLSPLRHFLKKINSRVHGHPPTHPHTHTHRGKFQIMSQHSDCNHLQTYVAGNEMPKMPEIDKM